MSDIGIFNWLENDMPGMIPNIPKITTSQVRGQGNPLGRTRDVQKYIDDIFLRNGLPRSLSRWAYSLLVEGATGTEMVQRMYDRPEFQERFKPIFERRRLFPGLPAISPQEVLEYEKQGMQLMRAAGMPPQFYDHYTDFQNVIANGVSMQELGERINDGFSRAVNSPRPVREAFANFFGPAGEAALAAFFLDPNKAMPALRLQVDAAGVAGAGTSFGFANLGRDRALEIASSGYDFETSADRWVSLVQTRPIFDETITERDDMQVLDEGVEAVFGLEGAGDSMRAIEQRRKERRASFAGGGGVMGSEQTGAAGLGTSGQ